MFDYLIGYKFGIVWEDEDVTEEYTIVRSNADIKKREVNLDTEFVKSIVGKNKGDVCVSKGNKFLIQYVVCPSFAKTCEERQIKHLYHFSAISNIDSIMKHGILSIDLLKANNIIYDSNDNERLDKHNNCISCSIEFPNGILLNNFKKRLKKRYAIFKISISALNYKYALCSTLNAATYGGAYIVGIDNFFKLYEGERLSMPDSFPTNEQAEVLINGKIEPQYIEQIIFETEVDEKPFKGRYNTAIDSSFFEYRDKFLGYKFKFNK